MASYKHNTEIFPERRGIVGAVFKSLDQNEHGLRAVRRARRFGRISGRRFLFWMFTLAAVFSIYLAVFGLKLLFHGEVEVSDSLLGAVLKDSSGSDTMPRPKRTMRRPRGGGDRGAMKKRAYDGLLLDAGGTLLQLAKPVADTYASIGRKYGLSATPAEIKQGFKRAFSAPWPQKLRYEGPGRGVNFQPRD